MIPHPLSPLGKEICSQSVHHARYKQKFELNDNFSELPSGRYQNEEDFEYAAMFQCFSTNHWNIMNPTRFSEIKINF